MPKRRRPTTSSPAAPQVGASAAYESVPVVPLTLFCGVTVIFLALYYFNAQEQTLAQRGAAWRFLVAPDILLSLWCGGSFSNFSLVDRWPIVLLAGTILAAAWLAGRLAMMLLGVV